MNSWFKNLTLYWLSFSIVQLILFFLIGLLIGHWLIINNKPNQVDAIHVLGGDSCDFHRTKHGISLYEQGIADTIIFSSAGEFLSDVLQASEQFGFPITKRIAIDNCLSTIDEARAVKALNKNYQSIVLVTDIYHTRRAMNTFKKVLKGVKIYSSPAKNCHYHDHKWWETEQSAIAVIDEVVKIIFYLFKYGICPL